MKFGTLAIHAGQEPDTATGAVMTPIYQTSTFAQSEPGVHKGYDYSRAGNPTRTALEMNLAALEGAKHCAAFSSGMGAIDAVVKLLKAGDHVVAGNDLYGGTYRIFVKVFEQFGLSFDFIDMSELANVKAALKPNTRLIWIETPTNPLLRIVDIEGISRLAKQSGALSVVDNTFATPYLQKPLSLGADIVVHSATKYIGGHSDVILGAAITNDDELAEKLHFIQKSSGATPGPFDCFLALRGTKTLHLRMQRHCENASRVAEFLSLHPNVKHVNYPGFKTHPNHDIAARQMSDFGGMLSFTLKNDDIRAARRLTTLTRVFTLAESLGGVESLIEQPATMTHASLPRDVRLKSGLEDSLIRLSVGVEDVDDLTEDLNQALRQV
ncbi:MAG: cystathionine gamma-synthase [Bacteroidetes bacterium]|jgi:cystathionine beta-lyase/cystathionine gamma-synthase|nr:cystathionine gamma-synthase [Bacteroidota bacterium]MCL5034346.1 cystathionine gamma-synthase [Bacteroidota bacterium]